LPDEKCKFIYKDQCDKICISMCPIMHELRDIDQNQDNEEEDVNHNCNDKFTSKKKRKKNVMKKNQRLIKGTIMKLNSMGFVYKLDS